jgi:hydrogenase-4 component B
MQYTASSFAQMLVQLFAWVLHPRVHAPEGQPLFARSAHFRSHVPDFVLDVVLRPTFRFGAKLTTSFRFLQQGSVHAYLFYIVAFLILLLVWK